MLVSGALQESVRFETLLDEILALAWNFLLHFSAQKITHFEWKFRKFGPDLVLGYPLGSNATKIGGLEHQIRSKQSNDRGKKVRNGSDSVTLLCTENRPDRLKIIQNRLGFSRMVSKRFERYKNRRIPATIWIDYTMANVPKIKDIGESFTFSKLDAHFAFRAIWHYLSAIERSESMLGWR